IKMMHKNEIVTFLFPSHIAYGYHGDNKKIGTNQSLICTVTLRNFLPDPTAKPAAVAGQAKTTSVAKPVTPTKPVAPTKKDTINP
ncbi:MAG: gliding motility-associated peptidyl-prolyl isomerase GldI, partial [Flavobacterium sp.]